MFLKTTEGFSQKNRDLSLVSDWIEAAVILLSEKVSKSDVVDIFNEENVFADKQEANAFVDNCWTEIKRRQRSLGNNKVLEFPYKSIIASKDWEEISPYSFCIAISLVSYYHKEDYIRRNYVEIGAAFEQLSNESLKILFPEWNLYHTGWSKKRAIPFPDLLTEIETNFNLHRTVNFKDYLSGEEKDATLDIIMSRQFYDLNCSVPYYLVQCASGQNWVNKRDEPDIGRWDKIIQFNSPLTRGLAIPFALSQTEFIFNSPTVGGLILDRYRLLSAYDLKFDWISPELSKDLNIITKKIINSIEQY